jgi:hypothetical protein
MNLLLMAAKRLFFSRDQPVDLLVAHHETHVQKEVSKTLLTLFRNVNPD